MYHVLKPAITARFVRILPVAWYGHISMRIELYGCLGNIWELGALDLRWLLLLTLHVRQEKGKVFDRK